MTTARLVLCCLLFSVPCSATANEIWQYGDFRPTQATITGGWEGTQYGTYMHDSIVHLLFGFDWEAETMTYKGFRVDKPVGTAGGFKSWTIGPGEEKTIDLYLRFDSLVIEGNGGHVVGLTAGPNGVYDIAGPGYSLATPLTLTGTYTVVGPTEEETGPFSLLLPDSSTISYSRLLSRNYPRNMSLQEETWLWWSGATEPFFDTVIDGEHVTAGLSGFGVNARFPTITPLLIPEPATWLLALIGILCVFVHRYGLR